MYCMSVPGVARVAFARGVGMQRGVAGHSGSVASAAVVVYGRRGVVVGRGPGKEGPILAKKIRARQNPFREIYDETAGPSEIPTTPVLGHQFNEKKRMVVHKGPLYRDDRSGEDQDLDVGRLSDKQLVLTMVNEADRLAEYSGEFLERTWFDIRADVHTVVNPLRVESGPVDTAQNPFKYTYKKKFFADHPTHHPSVRKVKLEFDPRVFGLPQPQFQKLLDLLGTRVFVNGKRRELHGRRQAEEMRARVRVVQKPQPSEAERKKKYHVEFVCSSFPSARLNREYIDMKLKEILVEAQKAPFPDVERYD
eukprot:Nk52_evm1s278 gene=Nk52_evmTU1s278